jgi:serine/threonine protein kinase
MVGRTINDAYLVQERIGAGGMGHVYRAIQINLGRPVALKLLRPGLASEATVVQRFHREARACSRLHHPNVIQVLDFGQTEDGRLFIVMEYVPGCSLLDVLHHESPLAEPRAVHLAAQILSALAEAHREGIVHRDLKPDNVMVESRSDEPEFVKVLDFGIAKLRDPNADDGRLTGTGVICGTPNYMSPEQASLSPTDARSDLYSVGVILFEMLTGRLPFQAATPAAMAQAHAAEPPPPMSERCPLGHFVSPALEALVLKALEKDPVHRFQTAEEMRRELTACPLAAATGQAASLHTLLAAQVERLLDSASPTGESQVPPSASATSTWPIRSAPLVEPAGEAPPRSPVPRPLAPLTPAPLPPPSMAAPDQASPARVRARSRKRLLLALFVAAVAASPVVLSRSRSAHPSSTTATAPGGRDRSGPTPSAPARDATPTAAPAAPSAAPGSTPSEPAKVAGGAQPGSEEPEEDLLAPAEGGQPVGQERSRAGDGERKRDEAPRRSPFARGTARAGAGAGATSSARAKAAAATPPRSPHGPSTRRTVFVTWEVLSFQQVSGNPALRERGRELVGRAHWVLEPNGTLTFAPPTAGRGLFPMKVRATRDGHRVKFAGTSTARARARPTYARISGLLVLGAYHPPLTLDLELGRAKGPDGAELDPTCRFRTRLRLAPD